MDLMNWILHLWGGGTRGSTPMHPACPGDLLCIILMDNLFFQRVEHKMVEETQKNQN